METINQLLGSALISSIVAVVTFLIAFYQWRKDIKIKLSSIYDEIATELIRERINPYSEFMEQLESMSSVHKEEILAHPEKALQFASVLQVALYNRVGLLSSYDTREFMVSAREGCKLFAEGKILYAELLKRLWAIHVSLKSDLGIAQPHWHTEIDRVRLYRLAEGKQDIYELTQSAPHIYHEKDSSTLTQ